MGANCPESCTLWQLKEVLGFACDQSRVVEDVTGDSMRYSAGVALADKDDPASYALDHITVEARTGIRWLPPHELEDVNQEIILRTGKWLAVKHRIDACQGMVEVTLIDNANAQVCQAELGTPREC